METLIVELKRVAPFKKVLENDKNQLEGFFRSISTS